MKTRDCDVWADLACLIEAQVELFSTPTNQWASGLCQVLFWLCRDSGLSDSQKDRLQRSIDALVKDQCRAGYCGEWMPYYLYPPFRWKDGKRLAHVLDEMVRAK